MDRDQRREEGRSLLSPEPDRREFSPGVLLTMIGAMILVLVAGAYLLRHAAG